MSVLLLVRHGQAHFGLRSYDQLSEQGRQQAVRLGRSLRERGVAVDRVVAGRLRRQRETATLLAEPLGASKVAIDGRWDEYDHLPLIARQHPRLTSHRRLVAHLALTRNDRRRSLQEMLDEALVAWVNDQASSPAVLAGYDDAGSGIPSSTPTSGVPLFATYVEEAHRALEDALDQPGVTLAVSSAGTIAAAIAPLLRLPPSAWPGMQRVVINTSVTKVVRGRRGLSLITFNEHAHLEGAPDISVTYR